MGVAKCKMGVHSSYPTPFQIHQACMWPHHIPLDILCVQEIAVYLGEITDPDTFERKRETLKGWVKRNESYIKKDKEALAKVDTELFELEEWKGEPIIKAVTVVSLHH